MGRPSGVCQDTGSPLLATTRAHAVSQFITSFALLNMVPSASSVICTARMQHLSRLGTNACLEPIHEKLASTDLDQGVARQEWRAERCLRCLTDRASRCGDPSHTPDLLPGKGISQNESYCLLIGRRSRRCGGARTRAP